MTSVALGRPLCLALAGTAGRGNLRRSGTSKVCGRPRRVSGTQLPHARTVALGRYLRQPQPALNGAIEHARRLISIRSSPHPIPIRPIPPTTAPFRRRPHTLLTVPSSPTHHRAPGSALPTVPP